MIPTFPLAAVQYCTPAFSKKFESDRPRLTRGFGSRFTARNHGPAGYAAELEAEEYFRSYEPFYTDLRYFSCLFCLGNPCRHSASTR